MFLSTLSLFTAIFKIFKTKRRWGSFLCCFFSLSSIAFKPQAIQQQCYKPIKNSIWNHLVGYLARFDKCLQWKPLLFVLTESFCSWMKRRAQWFCDVWFSHITLSQSSGIDVFFSLVEYILLEMSKYPHIGVESEITGTCEAEQHENIPQQILALILNNQEVFFDHTEKNLGG